MVPALRDGFNKAFTKEKYEAFLEELDQLHPGAIEFRIAETPVFVPKEFADKMIHACESIIDLITDPDFRKLTEASVPDDDLVANENDHTHFIWILAFVRIRPGELEPQLIEMQGFPTLFWIPGLLS